MNDEIPTPEWALSALLTLSANLQAEGQSSRSAALKRVALTLVNLIQPPSILRPFKGLSKADLELCAKCSLTYEGHIGNTGCVFPCWTPSGRYQEL